MSQPCIMHGVPRHRPRGRGATRMVLPGTNPEGRNALCNVPSWEQIFLKVVPGG